MMGQDCMTHRTNFVVCKLYLIYPHGGKVGGIVPIHVFMFLKVWHWKLSNLAKIVKTKGLEILINIKMQWMSMLEPLKCALVENKILIIKMSQENPSIIKASLNINFFGDVHTWLALYCLLPYWSLSIPWSRKGCLHFKFCGCCEILSNWPFYDVY